MLNLVNRRVNAINPAALVNTAWNYCFQQIISLLERDYVTFGSLLSQIRLSSVAFVRPTQGLKLFRQYFFAVLYLSHPLTSV